MGLALAISSPGVGLIFDASYSREREIHASLQMDFPPSSLASGLPAQSQRIATLVFNEREFLTAMSHALTAPASQWVVTKAS